jgi:DNA uptake protein ComE-like DNA-binding protein
MTTCAMPSRRRGSLLLVVSFLIVVTALLAFAITLRVQDDGTMARLRGRDDQLRAVAWSGVRVVLSQAQSQRPELLAGADLTLPETAAIYEDSLLGERGVVRFEPIGIVAGENAPRPIAAAQAACLDLNVADASQLERMGVDSASAGSLLSKRPAKGYVLPEDSPMLRAAAARSSPDSASRASDSGLASAPATDDPTRSGETTLRAEWFTTTSWESREPAVKAASSSSAGLTRKLLLGRGLTDDQRKQLEGVCSAELVAKLAPLLTDASWKGKPLGDAVRALAAAGATPRQVGVALALIAVEDEPFPKGRIDVLRASAPVLATLPGIDLALAERLVAARGSLDAASKADLAWPWSQDLLKLEQFAAIADRITNRSLQWRVRLTCMTEPVSFAPAPAASGSSSKAASDAAESKPSPSIRPNELSVEAIIDVAGPTPRVVCMYETTWLALAGRVESDRARQEVAEAPAASPEPVPTPSESPGVPTPPAVRGVMIPQEPDGPSTAGESGSQRPDSKGLEGGRRGRWRPR